MFENRLRTLLIIMAVPAVMIILRLMQLQIVQAKTYRTDSEVILHRNPVYYPPLRGDVVDRHGRPLAYNEGTWDISVHYHAMIWDSDRLRRRYSELDGHSSKDIEARIRRSWELVSDLTGEPLETLKETVERRVRKIQAIKASVSERHGFEMEVEEELDYWPVAWALDEQQQIRARVLLAEYPWVLINPGQKRVYINEQSLGPILGRMAEHSASTVDPHADDPFGKYLPGDRIGVMGAEAMGEERMRGFRGREHQDSEGKLLSALVEPIDGETMRLTLDIELQSRIYERLARAVRAYPYSSGASAVVLHVPTREIVALVSYPSYDPNINYNDWLELSEELPSSPTTFRAIGKYYAPGSTVKPMVLSGALASGVASAEYRDECYGHLLPGIPTIWRCDNHLNGEIDPVRSIMKSCNVFYYRLGEKLGVGRLTHWMNQFGLGRTAGTGLIEEKPGNLPTTSPPGPGQSRQMGIGQGPIDLTPLQSANMIATIASGEYQSTRLWMEDPRPRPATPLDIDEKHWRIVREGLYRVVNDREGTGYKAFFGKDRKAGWDRYGLVVMGKTGSAEPTKTVLETLYRVEADDGSVREIPAKTLASLRRRFPDAKITSVRSITLWPPRGVNEEITHAWFVCYLAPRADYHAPIREGSLSYALSVVIEYAGHGGDAAAPVARDILNDLIDLNTQQRSGNRRD